jgi:hypothetical protein
MEESTARAARCREREEGEDARDLGAGEVGGAQRRKRKEERGRGNRRVRSKK